MWGFFGVVVVDERNGGVFCFEFESGGGDWEEGGGGESCSNGCEGGFWERY